MTLAPTFTAIGSQGGANSESFTVPVSVGGAFIVIAVAVTGNGASGGLADITATYGGQPMVLRAIRLQSASNASCAIFTLANPPTGTNDLVVATPGGTAAGAGVFLSAFLWDFPTPANVVGGNAADGGANIVTINRTVSADALLLAISTRRTAAATSDLSAGWNSRANSNSGGITGFNHAFHAFDRQVTPGSYSATVTFSGGTGPSSAAMIELAPIVLAPVDVAASGALPLAGSATAQAIAVAAASGALALGGTASAIAIATASGAGLLPLGGNSAADAVSVALALGTLPLSGSSTALVVVPSRPRFRFVVPPDRRVFRVDAP